MTTGTELHEVNLVSSGKLKLRATAGLAEGGDAAIFEACVLFHEAARFERRAVDALSPCPPATRLAGSIEECWCLVEGRDPHGAAEVWSRILNESEDLEKGMAEAMLSRLRPRYDRAIRAFVKLLQTCPTLGRMQAGDRFSIPSGAAEQATALRELRRVLKEFPGIAALWGLVARLEEEAGNPAEAFEALRFALALAPENPQFKALSLLSAAEALPRAKADEYLAEVRPGLERGGAEVCLMYAFAEILLARRAADSAVRWQRALEAVDLAFPRTRSEGLRKNLTAVRLFLDDMIAKRKPDPQILYRAGLGRLAATGSGSVIDVLRADAAARVSHMDTSEVAA